MVPRMIRLVYREVRGLHQAAYVLGAFALASQFLALLRDRLLAHNFGASLELDLYYAAFRVPDLLYVAFASTLSVYVLVPFVASRLRHTDASQARDLLAQMFSVFLLIYSVVAVVIFILAPYLVHLLFPGFINEESDQLVTLLRILLLQPLFLGLSSLFGVVTQLGHRFILYAISPLLYNLGIIGGIVWLYPVFGLPGLTYGVVLGAIGHFAIQIPLVQSGPLRFGLVKRFDLSAIWSVCVVSLPRAATLAMHQLVLLALVSLASLMTVGSVAIFQLAHNLQSVPLAIVGASYSTAAFPLLADLFAQGKNNAFRSHLIVALRHIIFWSLPIIGLIIVLRAQLVRVVFGSGAFGWGDTRLTAAVLALLSVSLLVQAINLLLVRAFYAAGRTAIPFYLTLGGSFLTIISAVFFYFSYDHFSEMAGFVDSLLRLEGVEGTEVIILAIAYSLGVTVQTLALWIMAIRHFSLGSNWLWPHLGRALLAALVGATAAYLTLNFFVEGFNTERFIGVFLQGLWGGLAGIIGILIAYKSMGSPELSELYRSFRKRVFKTKVIASQDDII